MFRFLMLAAAAAMAIGWAEPAHADEPRAPTLDDILSLEAFGRASISPDGRWAVYEKRGAYEDTPRFDFGTRSVWTAFELWKLDLAQPARGPQRLLPDEGKGLLRGEWSPDGRRMLVYRFDGERYEVGTADPANGAVVWTGLTPETPLTGIHAQWLEDGSALLMVRANGELPALVRHAAGAQPRIARAWSSTAEGREPSRTVVDTRGGVASAETPEPLQRLVRLMPSGDIEPLLEGRLFDFSAAPDGRQVAVLIGGEPIAARPDRIVQAEGGRRQHLALLDLATGGIARPADELEAAPHLLRWKADSTEILLWGRRRDADWSAGSLFRIGPQGARALRLGDLRVGDAATVLRGIRAAWLGDEVVALAKGASGRQDWWRLSNDEPPVALTEAMPAAPVRLAAELEDTLLMFASGRLWRMTRTGIDPLTDPSMQLAEALIGDQDRAMRLTVNEPPRRDWVGARDPAGGVWRLRSIAASAEVTRLSAGAGETRVLALSPDTVLTLDRQGLSETLRLGRQGEAGAAVDQINVGLSAVEPARPVMVEHRDVLDRLVQSALFLPDGPPRGLIVQFYPGWADTNAWSGPLTLAYAIRPDLLVTAGYAVLSPSTAMEGEGAAGFESHARGLDLVLDAALAAHPQLDPNRVVLMGHSFGGYLALGVAARTARYRSIIASAAVSDAAGHWGELLPTARILPQDNLYLTNQQGWVETGQLELGAPPWVNPPLYIERSAFFSADRITAPVLLITADRDFVPMSQSERMFSAIHRLGGRARMVTYWGEGHHLWSPANIRDRLGQVLAWLDETLPDDPVDAPTP